MPIQPRGKIRRTVSTTRPPAAIFEPQFEIAAWCPDSKSEAPPEQLHFIIHWPVDFEDIPPMAIRFKSPDTLGFFIEELTRYRREIWPDSEPIEGEATDAAQTDSTIPPAP